MLGAAQERYLEEVVARLGALLGDDLAAAYLAGSGALGGWVAGSSDIDAIAICERPLDAPGRLVAALSQRALPCPARKLELVVYRRDAVRAPGAGVPFELNLNTGPGLTDHAVTDPALEPAHWFTIDLAIAREHGRPLLGPPPASLIGAPPPGAVRAALAESLAWYAEHEAASASAVLNACRAWCHTEEGVWRAKDDAGRWALPRLAGTAHAELVERALEQHASGAGSLDAAASRAFAARVRERVLAAGAAEAR